MSIVVKGNTIKSRSVRRIRWLSNLKVFFMSIHEAIRLRLFELNKHR